MFSINVIQFHRIETIYLQVSVNAMCSIDSKKNYIFNDGYNIKVHCKERYLCV